MKTYNQINNESKKVYEAIQAAEHEMDVLLLADEKKEAVFKKDFNSLKALNNEAHKNDERIAELTATLENLKLKQQILRQNRKAAVFNEGFPVLLKAFEKYEGKQYGTATKEKIYSEVRAAGYSFYFEGYQKSTSLKLYKLDENSKFCGGRSEEVYISCINYDIPFITSENKIQFAEAGARCSEKYIDNINKRVKELKKAYETYKTAVEKARAAESALNAIMPSCMNHYNKVGYISGGLVNV